MTDAVGPDGLTPRQRLEQRGGYEFDDRGRTVEIGHDDARNQREARDLLEFEVDAWAYFDERKPELELRCESTRQLIAMVHRDPLGALWVRGDPYGQVPLDDYANAGTFALLCPEHQGAPVPAQWIKDEAASTRRKAHVLCTDPYPVYGSP